MKKLLSIALSLLMVFSLVPAFAITASAYEDDTVCVIGSTEYTSLFGENGALESSDDGDVIILTKNIAATASATIDHEVTIDLAGYKLTLGGSNAAFTTNYDFTIRSTVDGKGETNTESKATLVYKANVVKTSATANISNISGMAAANTSIFAPTANTAKFVCKDSVLDSDTTAVISPVNFNYAATVDFDNVEITARGGWNNAAYITMGKGVKGTFKNCKFFAAAGGNIAVADNDTNVTFDGCNISEAGSDKWYVVNVSGGTATFSGGTIIDGKNAQNSVLQISGGKIITDDAIIQNDKADGGNKTTFVIKGGTVELGKTQILKGYRGAGLSVNDNAALANAIKPGYTAYTSSEYTAKTALGKSSDYQGQKALYIDVCQHFKTSATCEAAGTCNYCGNDIEALGHMWDEVQYNETQHWYVCTRCEKAGDAENHKGGSATCQEKAVCDVCQQPYGELAKHVFTNYVTSEACEHNTVKVAKCDFGCGTSDYDLGEATKVVEKTPRVEPTCVDKGSTEELICSECQSVVRPAEEIPAKGHTYGAQTIVTNPTYFTVGKAQKVCSECGDVYEYDLPKLSFSRNTVAIIAQSETNVEQFDALFGADGAIANAKDNDTIVLIKDIDENQGVTISDKNLTLDLAGNSITYSGGVAAVTTNADFTIRSTVDGNGVEKTDYASISYSKPIINSSAKAEINNISGLALADSSIIEASDVSAKLVAKDCNLDVKSDIKASPIKFKSVGCEIDLDNVNIIARGNWNNDAYLTFGNGVHGIVNNCSFESKSGGIVIIEGAATNVELKACTFVEGGNDKGSVVTVSSGTVKFSGGTTIDGRNSQNCALVINGGNVYTDDAIIKGDKGDGTNKMPLKINGGNVNFGKTIIQRGTSNGQRSILCNSNDALKSALADGYTFFYSEETTGEFAYVYADNVDYTKEKIIYIDKCEHWNTTATCTEAGNCIYCNKDFEALGHDYSGFDGDDENHWAVCIRCNEKSPDAVNVAHSGGTATCTEAKVCEVCGMSYGDPNGHDFSAGIYACDAENHWIQCANCSEGRENVEAHTETSPADCTNSAYCDVCKSIYGDPLGHNFQGYKYNNDATCEKAGTETGKCSRCKAVDTRTSETHPALGHKAVALPYVPATCTTKGSIGGEICERCDKIMISPQEEPINPKAHAWDAGKIVNKVDCLHDQEMLYTCTLCNETKTEVIGKGDHNWTNPVVLKPATCVSGGYTRYTCSVCGETKLEEVSANSNNHTWNGGNVIIAATCVSTGTIEYTCTSCGVKRTATIAVNPNAHKFSDSYIVDKQATLFATGVKSKHCIYCNASTDATTIAKDVLGKAKATVTGGKKAITVKYKATAKATGFQVKYKIGKKTVTKNFNTKKAAKKVIKVKAGSYKVQVRAYAKQGKAKVYSSWTKAKTVKVK